jgi:hypothetical protein
MEGTSQALVFELHLGFTIKILTKDSFLRQDLGEWLG